jgi:hypothetical protein
MPIIAFLPIKCPRYTDCQSEQCPLNPDHSVEDILPANKCHIGEAVRLRITSQYAAGQYLPYEGRTRAEYLRIVNGLQIKVAPTKAELRAQAQKERQMKLDEIRKRMELIQKFKSITDNLSVEDLALLIEDIAIGLSPDTNDIIVSPI